LCYLPLKALIKARREWDMKANRKFVEENEAVSAVIGVILMVAITVAIAATVYVYVSGMLGTGPAQTPTVSMIQSGAFVSITGVENGPVVYADATVSWVNQTSGGVTTGSISHGGADDTIVDGGDSIALPGSGDPSTAAAGSKFTVQILYGGDVIGSCVYTVQ
jgi:flagellin-like protein